MLLRLLASVIAIASSSAAWIAAAPATQPAPVTRPAIVLARDWGSLPQTIPATRAQTPARLTIHHAGELWRGNEDPVMRLCALQKWGQRDKKWPDLPYHFLISPDGVIHQGRNLNFEPESNTKYALAGHVGIQLWGNYEAQRVNLAQLRAIVSLAAWLCQEHRIDPATLAGHKDAAPGQTSCPGKDLHRYIANGDITRWVRESLAGKTPEIRLLPALEGGPTTMAAALPVIGPDTPPDPAAQKRLADIDAAIRTRLAIPATAPISAGVYDLRTGRLAMIRPDEIEYAASIPKIAILLTFFDSLASQAATRPGSATMPTPEQTAELGRMIKASDNAIAAKYSQQLGLARIAATVQSTRYALYNKSHGGGLWMGKHYGPSPERQGDPLTNTSHAATVRSLLRFYLLLDQGRLVNADASKAMLAIFDSPELKHTEIDFVAGLKGRPLQILRKHGQWQSWHSDSAIIQGESRRYILVALTNHEKGAQYLEALAAEVDNWMSGK